MTLNKDTCRWSHLRIIFVWHPHHDGLYCGILIVFISWVLQCYIILSPIPWWASFAKYMKFTAWDGFMIHYFVNYVVFIVVNIIVYNNNTMTFENTTDIYKITMKLLWLYCICKFATKYLLNPYGIYNLLPDIYKFAAKYLQNGALYRLGMRIRVRIGFLCSFIFWCLVFFIVA